MTNGTKQSIGKKRENLHVVFGKDTPYNDLKLRETYSGLYAELKRFIMQEELKSDDFFNSTLSCSKSAKTKRPIKPTAPSVANSKNGSTNTEHKTQNFIKKFSSSQRRPITPRTATASIFDKALQEMLDALDAFYFSLKLRESL